MLALIDGDIIVYRIGYTTQNDEEWIARWRANEMIEGILRDTESSEFRIYLSDSTENGFRKSILPSYKANRTQPKPKHYEFLKEYLLTEWNAKIAVGEEADDRLGIEQDWFDGPPEVFQTVICSIDKDLRQIPGWHYNFVTRLPPVCVGPTEGLRFFYQQILTGDRVDNIEGLYNIGPTRSKKILKGASTEADLFRATFEAYRTWMKDSSEEEVYKKILVNGRVLKIRTIEEEIWNFPQPFTQHQPTLDYQHESM
jgi:5'-3' exonuclease